MSGALHSIGSALDNALAVLAPRAAFRRMAAREAFAQRMYAAAKVSRSHPWVPIDQNVNLTVGSSSRMVRARVRQLVRDFPHFGRAVRVLTDYTVGNGIRLQARVKGSDGQLDKATNQKIEDAYQRWADEADASGKLHLHEMQRLAKRQDVECGEALFIRSIQQDDRGRFLPLSYLMIEPDWLAQNTYMTSGGGTPVIPSTGGSDLALVPQAGYWLDQGVEFDPLTGRPVAYHLMDPMAYRPPVRIQAEDVIHAFEMLRPGQLRGISVFAPAVLLAQDLREFMDSEIDAAKMASKWLGFVETGDLPGFQKDRTKLNPQTGQRVSQLENALIEYLQPGEKVSFASHNRPNGGLGDFSKLILRMLSVTAGVPYELISGDYDGISYSNLRGIRLDAAVAFKPLFDRHVRQICRPMYLEFLDWAVLSGRLNLPGYYRDRAHYQRHSWVPTGMESVDPLRETKSYLDQKKAGTRSEIEMINARGREPEEVLDEIAQFQAMAAERGVNLAVDTASLKDNPAALGAVE